MAPMHWARRFGYALAALIDAVILYLVNVRPGWEAVPFLTDATPEVLGLLNLSVLAGVAANLVYMVNDGPWVRRPGDLITTTIGLAVLIRTWQVFPFDFAAWAGDWGLVARILLGLGMVGTAVAIVAHGAALVRMAVERHPRTGGPALR